MTRPLPPEVETQVDKYKTLLVRSLHFKAIIAAARSAPVATDAELAAILVIGLAEVCANFENVISIVTRATMQTTRPFEELCGGMLACVPSSRAAEPTEPPPPSPTSTS
jgi:hypothetical protein